MGFAECGKAHRTLEATQAYNDRLSAWKVVEMATAQSKLDILIAAKNNASPAIKQITGDIKGMDQAAGNLSKGIGGLAMMGGVAGIAALGGAAVTASVDLARLAAQATDVEASFQSMAGAKATEMFAGLKAASRGAISDFDLMLSANRAMLLGVADTAGEMTALMDVARSASQAMGTSTTQAFDDLLRGIGTGQRDLIDNLGISISLQSAYEEYAKSLGTTASKLSDVEKKQATVNAVLKESAALVKANAAAGDDATSKFERMDAAIANTKVALGEFVSPAVTLGAGMLTGYLEGQIEMLHKETDLLNSAYVAAKNFATGNNEVSASTMAYAEAAGRADAVTHNLTFGLTNLGDAARTAGDGLTVAEIKAANLTTRLAGLKAQSDAAISALSGIESSALSQLESAASGAVGVGMGAGTVAEIYTENAERIRAQIKAMDDLGLSDEYLMFKSQELADKAAEPFNLAIEAAREASRATGGYVDSLSDAEQAAQQAFSNIASIASNVLSGALNTGVASASSILESMGLREDAINEDARRLADVAVKGFDSPWADYFRTTHPGLFDDMFFGDIKAVAAQQLKDFEDGLNPELILSLIHI